MTTNNSSTGGYLDQKNAFLEDDALIDAVQELVVSVLGLPATLVRPRWQPNPPRQPEANIDWVAIGITSRRPLDYPYIKHSNGGPDTLTRWTMLSFLASMYGPHAQRYAEQFRDALYIAQNLEALGALSIRMNSVGELTAVPELVNNVWVNRADMPFTLAMEVKRDYDIRDIDSALVSIFPDPI